MSRQYLETLAVENYGCVKQAQLRLTPLHAFIGPNDAGKSTLLRAVRDLARYWSETQRPAFSTPDGLLAATASTGETVRLRQTGGDLRDVQAPPRPSLGWLAGASLFRLDPDALRQPAPLIPAGQPIRFADERGSGLPAVLDALRDRNDGSFEAIDKLLCALFPTVRRLQLARNPQGNGKQVQVELTSGVQVPAEGLSEGMLYLLAFAALERVDRTPIVLVEEPENGLHPARIGVVMKTLRAISQTTQVLVATHSPLVINELSPNEVTVVTRSPEQGTQTRLLGETRNFAERSKVYALGELWLAYADGTSEEALVAP